MLLAIALMGLTAWADQTQGEWGKNYDGTPAMSGQATMDHLFVRGTYDGATDDNTIMFKYSDEHVVWFWLDDDEIYQNAKVQALTPIPYNLAGDLYNEITYNSFQCDLYLPEHFSLEDYEDEEGDVSFYRLGERFPNSSILKCSGRYKSHWNEL